MISPGDVSKVACLGSESFQIVGCGSVIQEHLYSLNISKASDTIIFDISTFYQKIQLVIVMGDDGKFGMVTKNLWSGCFTAG